MKQFITDRHQIAQALNFGKYPVIFTDLKAARTRYGWCLADIRLDHGEEFEKAHGYRFEDGDLYIYNDNFNLTVDRQSPCIKSYFGAEDVFEMAERAVAPTIPIKAGQEVILVFKTITRHAVVLKVKIDTVNPELFCMTPFKFEDANMKSVLEEMGEGTSEEAVDYARENL